MADPAPLCGKPAIDLWPCGNVFVATKMVMTWGWIIIIGFTLKRLVGASRDSLDLSFPKRGGSIASFLCDFPGSHLLATAKYDHILTSVLHYSLFCLKKCSTSVKVCKFFHVNLSAAIFFGASKWGFQSQSLCTIPYRSGRIHFFDLRELGDPDEFQMRKEFLRRGWWSTPNSMASPETHLLEVPRYLPYIFGLCFRHF